MKHCIYCGLELPDGVTVCNGCKQIVGPSPGSQGQNSPGTVENSSRQKAVQAAAEKREGILAKVRKFIGF